MPRFKITAYEEVHYQAEIDADDEDQAYDIYTAKLGDYHPTAISHSFDVTSIREVKPSTKRGKKSDDKHIKSSNIAI